jgi:hypothetical protein
MQMRATKLDAPEVHVRVPAGREMARDRVPEINRVLLDLWMAEAQQLGGVLYLTVYQSI